MTKIDLITGILGAGKTTFLHHYAKYLLDQGLKIAILENDFGAVNVDMLMLQDLKSENCHLAMVAGCCGDADCHKRRFKTQLINLGMMHFDRILIEPSGIFDMDEFFDTLHETPLDHWFTIGSILTIADGDMEDTLPPHMEFLFGSEAACCGRMILSKLSTQDNAEVATERILGHLERSMEMIHCKRRMQANEILAKCWDDLTEQDFIDCMEVGYQNHSYVKLFHNDTIASSVHYFMHIRIPEAQIPTILQETMADTACGDIARIKGSLQNDAGSWLKINMTKEKLEIAPVKDGQSVLIVIGDNISKEAVDSHFTAYNTDTEYVSV